MSSYTSSKSSLFTLSAVLHALGLCRTPPRLSAALFMVFINSQDSDMQPKGAIKFISKPVVRMSINCLQCCSVYIYIYNMFNLTEPSVCLRAEVEDVVNSILFLLSEKSNMINGVTLPVDGGFLAC